MQAFPNTARDLVADLNKLFPEPSVGPDTSMDKIKFDAGQRSVIQFLNQWLANPTEAVKPARRGQGRPV